VSLGLAGRFFLAAILLGIGFASLLGSWGPLRNVFEEQRDNAVAAYIAFASIYWIVAATAFASAALLIRSAWRMPFDRPS
jgi:Ca2+/H+ antiporter